MKKCIIIANGVPPKKSEINYFIKNGFDKMICADGGANSAFKLGIIPTCIIGDFDSIESSTLKYFKNKSRLINIKRQNDTDVEKCLKFLIKKKYTEVVLLGGTGNRLDHSIYNLGIVKKYFAKIRIILLSGESILIPIKGETEFKTTHDEIISLYGFDKKTKFFSKGLKYPLKNIALPFGGKGSTSNQVTGNLVNLKVSGGIGFIIRSFKMIKKNGLI